MLGHVERALARRHASEDRLRSFAADASHELRTPLAAIRGYAELARRTPGHGAARGARTRSSRVGAESARMSGLVDDLLLLARLDAGRPLEREPVDLTRLAIDATSDARAAGARPPLAARAAREPVLVPRRRARGCTRCSPTCSATRRTHTPAGHDVTVAVRRRPAPARPRSA